MTSEFKHKTVGSELTQTEWEGIGTHVFDSQATGDILYASSGTQLKRLGIGSTNNLLTISGGIPAWTATPSVTSLTVGTLTISTALNMTVTSTSADNLVQILATNTATSGTASANKTTLTVTGDGKTYAITNWLELSVGGNTTNAHGIYMYCGNVDDKTISNYTPIYVYVEDIGDSVSNFGVMSLETNIESGNNATEHCFVRFREHDTVNTASHVFRFEGANSANFMFWFDAVNSNMLDNGTTAGDQCVGHIKIKRDTSTAYINVYSDNS